ncbi:MAG: ser/Thr protein phosphatase [Massilia sp.]|nr:ser/Thr protein phosphatase [Massilia sp.]
MRSPLYPVFSATAVAMLLLVACSGNIAPAEAPVAMPSVAFMSDVHFENVYGDLKNAQFNGIPTKDGKNATIRTMYAELTSTRLFNENYFAFRAALDDAYGKGIRLVALPGDYSDDAQPVNINGISDILHEYQAKGMRFFMAPGNHDPDEPYDNDEAGKNDFLTKDGKEQKVYAINNAACTAKDPSVVCTNQLMELGYENLIAKLADFGFMPNKADLHWETPFSKYTDGKYSYDQALASGDVKNRQFEICAEGEGGSYKAEGEKALGKPFTKCSSIIDSSYLVEPVKGLWLLSIDANVHIPNSNFEPANPKVFKGFDGAGNAGWNKVLTHKKHQMEWIIGDRARQGAGQAADGVFPLPDHGLLRQPDQRDEGRLQAGRLPDRAGTGSGDHQCIGGDRPAVAYWRPHALQRYQIIRTLQVTSWSTCSRRRSLSMAPPTRS